MSLDISFHIIIPRYFPEQLIIQPTVVWIGFRICSNASTPVAMTPGCPGDLRGHEVGAVGPLHAGGELPRRGPGGGLPLRPRMSCDTPEAIIYSI